VEVAEGAADQEVLEVLEEEQVVQVVEQESQDNLLFQNKLLSNLYCTNHHFHRWGSCHRSFRRPSYSNNT
jgi:hypothetical protein